MLQSEKEIKMHMRDTTKQQKQLKAREIIENKNKPKEPKWSFKQANNHKNECDDDLPVVGLEVYHGECQCGPRACYVYIYSVTLLEKQINDHLFIIHQKKIFFIFLIPALIW